MTEEQTSSKTDGTPGHIYNVGNIHMENLEQVQHKQVLSVQNNQWRSSGSIFECEQGCFNDDDNKTVVI